MDDGSVLRAGEAYRHWAPRYEDETAVSALEDRIVRERTPSVDGRELLDAGCGTGRRLRPHVAAARRAVGVDLVPEMLGVGRAIEEPVPLVAADVRSLPFPEASFDLLWCRLVLGHLPDLSPAYRELGRVGRSGADLIVSDFHPAAVAAGHSRTFRDAEGRLRTVEHHVHVASDHTAAATAAGWTVRSVLDVPAGQEERRFWERAGRLDQFENERELPLVLALWFRRG